MSDRYVGTVRQFKETYGFITPQEGGDDVFVHYSKLVGEGFRTLKKGQLVEYSLGKDEKGTHAEDVVILK